MTTTKTTTAPRWYDYKTGAEYLGCNERQLRRWVQQGRVGHTKLGLRVQFSREQLDRFLADSTVQPTR